MRTTITGFAFHARYALQFLVFMVASACWIPPALSQTKIPVGGMVYNYVGHAYINPTTGSGEVAGYFSSIAGIETPFDGAPSEATAYFTYRSEPLTFTALPADVDTALTLLNAGKWHIYFSSNPASSPTSWADPASFSQGQLVADLDHTALQIVSSGPVHQAVFSGELLASYDFVYAGRTINFAQFFPNGITNFGSATNTLVQGGAPGFPIVFADAGWAVAKGHTVAGQTNE
jgi:hypothetical protein